MFNATLMKIEYNTKPRRGYGCRLHFHVKGKQAKKFIIDHVFYWVGNSMEKHKKYSIYVSTNEKHALLSRWKTLFGGIILIGVGIGIPVYFVWL